jgi:hypothetical protein
MQAHADFHVADKSEMSRYFSLFYKFIKGTYRRSIWYAHRFKH